MPWLAILLLCAAPGDCREPELFRFGSRAECVAFIATARAAAVSRWVWGDCTQDRLERAQG